MLEAKPDLVLSQRFDHKQEQCGLQEEVVSSAIKNGNNQDVKNESQDHHVNNQDNNKFNNVKKRMAATTSTTMFLLQHKNSIQNNLEGWNKDQMFKMMQASLALQAFKHLDVCSMGLI